MMRMEVFYMQIEVRPLAPELAQTYVDFLSSPMFDHAPHWASCFCRFYHLSCTQEAWQARSAKTNREEAITEIEAGRMKGYLAFHEGQCIGWLNANGIEAYPGVKAEAQKHMDLEGLALAICFVVAGEFRNKGVSKALLTYAMSDLKARGFTKLLAMPVDRPEQPETMYRGIKRSYEAMGFEALMSEGPMSIMLKTL